MKDDRPNTAKSCSLIEPDELDPDRSLVIVPKSNTERLTEKEFVDCRTHRKQLPPHLTDTRQTPCVGVQERRRPYPREMAG